MRRFDGLQAAGGPTRGGASHVHLALDDGMLGRLLTPAASRAAMWMLWVVFCLLVGWAASVLLLYGIGVVVDPLVVAALGYFGWRRGLIPEGMSGFGAGVSLALIPFLVGNLRYLDDPLLVVLAFAGIAAGPIISMVGGLLMLRSMRTSA